MDGEDATCLFDWFIEPVLSRDASGERNELQLLGERVGGAGYFGFTAWGVRQTAERQGGDPGDGAVADQALWQTSVVVDVRTDGRATTILTTESGSRYRLVGEVDAENMETAGWDAQTVQQFRAVNQGRATAFPLEWRAVLMGAFRTLYERLQLAAGREDAVSDQPVDDGHADGAHASAIASQPTAAATTETTERSFRHSQNARAVGGNDASEARWRGAAAAVPPGLSREARRLVEQLVRLRFHHPDAIFGQARPDSLARPVSLSAPSHVHGIGAVEPLSPPRRRRGRPRKYPRKDESGGAESQPSRHPGRPRKYPRKEENDGGAAAPKRPRGRPRKHPVAAAEPMPADHRHMLDTDAHGDFRQVAGADNADDDLALAPLPAAYAYPIATEAPRALPAKRPRGRPRKHPVEPSQVVPPTQGDSSAAVASTDASAMPVKRPRGRPRKHPTDPSRVASSGQGSRSTAATSAEPAVAPVKRPRGRPRKHPLPAADAPNANRASNAEHHHDADAAPDQARVRAAMETLSRAGPRTPSQRTLKQRAAFRLVAAAANYGHRGDSVFAGDADGHPADDRQTVAAQPLAAHNTALRGQRSIDAYLRQLQRRRKAGASAPTGENAELESGKSGMTSLPERDTVDHAADSVKRAARLPVSRAPPQALPTAYGHDDDDDDDDENVDVEHELDDDFAEVPPV